MHPGFFLFAFTRQSPFRTAFLRVQVYVRQVHFTFRHRMEHVDPSAIAIALFRKTGADCGIEIDHLRTENPVPCVFSVRRTDLDDLPRRPSDRSEVPDVQHFAARVTHDDRMVGIVRVSLRNARDEGQVLASF